MLFGCKTWTTPRYDAARSRAMSAPLCLQAIRWRLIRSPAGQQRQLVLQILIGHDILGCEDHSKPSLIATLVHLGDTALTTQLLQVISVMASDHKGRAYLVAADSTVIQDLFGILSTMPVAAMHRKEGTDGQQLVDCILEVTRRMRQPAGQCTALISSCFMLGVCVCKLWRSQHRRRTSGKCIIQGMRS